MEPVARLDFDLQLPYISLFEKSSDDSGIPSRQWVNLRVCGWNTTSGEDWVATLYRARSARVRDDRDGATLSIRVPGSPSGELLRNWADLAVAVLDTIQLQLHEKVELSAVNAVDVTPEMKIGDQRVRMAFANPSSIIGGRFFSGYFSLSWQISGATLIDLPGELPPTGDKVRLAQWWYLKSMEAPLAIDQFLALWAAIEVMRPLDWEGISAPLTLRCGHNLPECPECGASVDRVVNGKTMKKYLEGIGMLAAEANKLWDIRQAVHGANRFTSSHVTNLGPLLVKFRPIVLAVLKRHLDIAMEGFPQIRYDESGPVMTGGTLTGVFRPSNEDIALERHQSETLSRRSSDTSQAAD
jgi:hypothetical protein